MSKQKSDVFDRSTYDITLAVIIFLRKRINCMILSEYRYIQNIPVQYDIDIVWGRLARARQAILAAFII